MRLFDRLSDKERQARKELRSDQLRRSLDEATRMREEQGRFEQDRERRRRDDEERLRQLDMRDGRYDGRI